MMFSRNSNNILCNRSLVFSRGIGLWLLLVFYVSTNVFAQKPDTSKNVNIDLTAKNVFFYKTDSGDFHKFVGNAVFIQGTDTLYCDSLYQNNTTKNIEAFGNVKIVQTGGTQAKSEYLRYTSGKKIAYMHTNVSLTDGRNRLNCEELTYDLGTKTGVYNKGGTLITDSTTVHSIEGVYDVNTKNARFKRRVLVRDVRYDIASEDLGYNMETKLITFFASSVVKSDSGKSTLKTSNGTYESVKGIAHFVGRSSIFKDEYYLEGDSLYYNKLTGYGLADGNVISIDTMHHSTLYCGHLEYFRKKRILWATIKPVLEQVNGRDTFYMRADTFYSYPALVDTNAKKVERLRGTKSVIAEKPGADSSEAILAFSRNGTTKTKENNSSLMLKSKVFVPTDSSGVVETKKIERKNKKVDRTENKMSKRKIGKQTTSEKTVAVIDTTQADTTAPLIFIGYHHVRIFSDSLQGKCDSISYSRADSTIRLIYSPIAWSHGSQITGDTIILRADDSGNLKSMFVPNNACVVSLSGPPRAKLFDQVQGKTLTAYMKDNTINNMVVVPNSEAIYFTRDEHGGYIGESEAKSERIKIYFANKQMDKIIFEKDVHQTLTPMEKVDFPNAHLSRFKWLIDQRPKTKKELFE